MTDNNIYLGSFEYDAREDKGMSWMPNQPQTFELYFQHTIIGDFLMVRREGATQKIEFIPINTKSPYPPIAEAKKRAKAKGLI